MKRKLISVLLIAVMVATMLAGCGKAKTSNETVAPDTETAGEATDEKETAGEETAQAEPTEVEKIKIYLPTAGKVDDIAKVMEAVNNISREKIGVEAEIKPYEFGQWFQQYPLFISGTEDVDIIANYGGYLNAVSQGAAYDITELLQTYGQDIIAMEGDYLKSGSIKGVQYAIPIYASYAWNMGIIYRQDIVDELGLGDKVAAVKSLEDWEVILAAVKEAKPDMTPIVRNSGNTTPNFQYGLWDDLGNNYGVLMNGGETSEVVNLFETEQYAQLCGIFYDWYQKGYLNKDVQTQTDGFTVLAQNDAAFSTLGQTDFNTAFYQSTTVGKPMGAIMLGEPVARTYNNVTYSIMSNTEHAEACMKFLNLWFSDVEVGNLISYGIEGEHYQLNAEGMGTYLEGQQASTTTYRLGAAINNTNRIRWDSENPEYAKLLIESNSTAKKSAALGFGFDPTPVTNEITQLDNIRSKYQVGLESGALDPQTYLPKFITELKEAGLDTVIAEKQKQLDEFLAANN
jgi:putative aldouronate transport system substrate-binding protein